MRTWPFNPRHLVLLPLAAVMLVPLVWMLVTSIETLPETRHFPPTLVPSGIHWQNYPDALDAAPFGRFFANSLDRDGRRGRSGTCCCAAWRATRSRGCASSAATSRSSRSWPR